MCKEDEKLLLEFINSFNGAISTLSLGREGKAYPKEANMMILIFIDQLGWLNSKNEFSDGSDFKKWVERYIDCSNLNCTADDLWVARCSLLHMGTTVNKNFKINKEYQIAFYQSLSPTVEQIKIEEGKYSIPTKLVSINQLVIALGSGVGKFIDEIFNNFSLKQRVIEKLKKMPSIITLH